MENSIFKKANLAFNQGDFNQAKKLYQLAGELIGQDLVKFNLALCEKRLKNNKLPTANKLLSVNDVFDHVYVVNLKTHTQNKLKISNHLFQNNVNFELFEATNGYEGEPLKRYKEYQKRPLGQLVRYPELSEREKKRKNGFIESAGAVGYIFTYLRIMRDAKAKGYQKILILEDDIILANNFEQSFHNFMSGLPNTWKVLQLGASQYGWSSVELNEAEAKGHYAPRQLDTCGSFALALDASVFDELIEAEEAFEGPFDHLPLGEIYEKYLSQCFVAYPNVVMPDVSDSTIRGGRCQYDHGKKMKWQVGNFDFPLSRPSINVLINSKQSLKYLTAFNVENKREIDFRLFINTIDGLRAVHNPELLDLPYNKIINAKEALTLPKADYTLSLPSDCVLTEEGLAEYVYFSTGIKSENNTGLTALHCSHPKIIDNRVSVIIPTYKRPTNLANALRSVAEQDYDNKEILVICDNGIESEYNAETDGLVKKVQAEFPDVSIQLIYHQKNRNGAAARNTGFLASTGEFICLLDDDDMYLPGRIKESVNVLSKQRKGVEGVYCGFLGWNSPVNDLERYKVGNLSKEILLLDYKKHYLHTNTATYTRAAYAELNGFDESYRRHQDLEFNLRFFELFDIGAVKEGLVRLNPEPSDISNKVFNTDMLLLKNKFLTQFSYTLNDFPRSLQNEIYQKHWDEVYRYASDKQSLVEYLNTDFKNGNLQIKLLLNKSDV